MEKSFWLILGAVMVGLVGLFILTGSDDDGGTNVSYTEATEVQQADHKQGDNPDIVLIEYGDFQCPGCAALFPLLNQVKDQYGEDLTFVFRHYPLTTIHPQAMAAHRAAEAAGNQGFFFPMHDVLYSRQQEWSGASNASEIFERYAEELGLNMDQYRADVQSEAVFDRIDADIDSGSDLGIQSTPTLLLNGEIMEEIPQDIQAWSELIESVKAEQSNGEPSEEQSTEPEEAPAEEPAPAQ